MVYGFPNNMFQISIITKILPQNQCCTSSVRWYTISWYKTLILEKCNIHSAASDIISMGKSVHHFKIKIFFSCFFSSYTPCIRRRITPWIERLDSLSHSTMNNIYHDCCWEDSKRSESSFDFKYAHVHYQWKRVNTKACYACG